MPKLDLKCVSEGFNLACAPADFAPGRAEKKCFFLLLACEKTGAPDVGCNSFCGKPCNTEIKAFCPLL